MNGFKNYQFQVCRAFPGTHRWVDTGAIPVSDHGIGYTYICEECGTEKDVFYDRRGVSAAARYRYPDGYALPGVVKSDLRVHFMRKTERRLRAVS